MRGMLHHPVRMTASVMDVRSAAFLRSVLMTADSGACLWIMASCWVVVSVGGPLVAAGGDVLSDSPFGAVGFRRPQGRAAVMSAISARVLPH